MKRRDFILALGGAAVAPSFLWTLTARAQTADRTRRIALMMPYAESDSESQVRIAALRESLEKLGWSSRNLRLEFRWDVGNPERARSVAKELVASAPDLIMPSTTQMLAAVQAETRTIAIVSSTSPIRSAPAWWRASPGPAATPRGSPISNMRPAANGWRSSRRSRPR
jgi:ABC-type uncharacterized transport system substrate-binding protein